jgi:RNA polymerase sigma-70 factor (ECF subfamily)
MWNKLQLLTETKFETLNPTIQKEIYREYYDLVYSSILFMVKDHASTEDIIQVSFLKLINKIPQFEDPSKLVSWIRVVVRNTVFTFLRKNKKNVPEVNSESYIFENMETTKGIESIENDVELKIMTEAISRCLIDLKPEHKALIELRWKKELSYREIAEQIESTEEAVKYKLYRAREALKKRFLREWGDRNE